jgi:hypothetical protein
MSGVSANHRPSEFRRKALTQELSVPCVSNFFDIHRYYASADVVYKSFQEAFRQDRLDEAYVLGKRYCMFCLDAIPKHNYYSIGANLSLKQKHNQQVNQVIQQLENVAAKMDVEEVERAKREAMEMQLLQQEKDRLRDAQLNALQTKIAQQQHQQHTQKKDKKDSANDESVKLSALSKLALLAASPPLNGDAKSSNNSRIKLDPSGEEPRVSTRYGILDDSSDDEANLSPPKLPPQPLKQQKPHKPKQLQQLQPQLTNGHKVHPPPPPPSYDQIASRRITQQQHQQQHIQKPHAQPQQPIRQQPRMFELVERYKRDLAKFQSDGRIRVTPIPTYQGRTADSTNGCTVISALIAARHLTNATLTTSAICQIVDVDCVPILKRIRRKLGLGPGALIIPSDVHDDLVDHKLLRQDDFEGAAGGNVLDAKHLGEFTRLLAGNSKNNNGNGNGNKHCKAAATLFFREHVVSIVKLTNGQYDLIDSLPGLSNNGRSMASRTHCQDLESLHVLLRWYTSRKLTESDCLYIDQNKWDDGMADMDPRVFQGFVWMVK